MLKIFEKLEYNCFLSILLLVLPFLVNMYHSWYLFYLIMLDQNLGSFNKSQITEYLYVKNIVKDIKHHRLINFVTYSTVIVPFSYIGIFYINYIFPTLFLDVVYILKMYDNYIKNYEVLKFTIKDNQLVKIDNYPKYLRYNVINEDEPSDNIDDNILNIIIKGPIVIEKIEKTKIYKNIYISHNEHFRFNIEFEI